MALTEKEYKRKFRVLDQMLTAHATERDRFGLWALLLTLLVMAASVVATAVAFLSGERLLPILGIHARVQTWVGCLTALIFFLGIFDLRVDWREKAGVHDLAARELGELKGSFRRARIEGGQASAGGVDLGLEYDRVMAMLPPIPDRRFLALKAKHRRKVVISQLLDDYPATPVPVLRLWLLAQGLSGRAFGAAQPPISQEGPASPKV